MNWIINTSILIFFVLACLASSTKKNEALSKSDDESITYIHKRLKGASGLVRVAIPKGKDILIDHKRGDPPKNYNSVEQRIARGAKRLIKKHKNLDEKEAIQKMQEHIKMKDLQYAKRRKEYTEEQKKKHSRKDGRKSNGPRSYNVAKERSIKHMLNRKILNREQAEERFEAMRVAKRKRDREAKQLKRQRERQGGRCTSTDESGEQKPLPTTESPSRNSQAIEDTEIRYTEKRLPSSRQLIKVEIPSAEERLRKLPGEKCPRGFRSKEQIMSRGIERLTKTGIYKTQKEAIEELEKQYDIERKQNSLKYKEWRRKKRGNKTDKRKRPGIGYAEARMTSRMKTLLNKKGNDINTPKDALKLASKQWEEVKKKNREQKRAKKLKAKSEAP